MLVELMAQSEPCLFANRSEPAVKPFVVSQSVLAAVSRMLVVAEWHAELQREFWRELYESEAVLEPAE